VSRFKFNGKVIRYAGGIGVEHAKNFYSPRRVAPSSSSITGTFARKP